MYTMSSSDFTVHTSECDAVGSGMPISSLPDEVQSLDDLDCDCWDVFDSFEEIE
ncbi:hypothetical protein GL213_00070 [Halogeometricum borinquense]|uniref:Uncharacterized protein n=1 Tax=Halogeometricum borinquense (strain ATCC 700274 / DSM 11551 / JCM 10706 / KCTC 4070 / PR3) TaxID=469382 RepID=E4NR01_HALBP|nr:hypothetical protein [Halogeometricum borinquense]ADQ65627.1 hypothetical protein Hbor_00140 [Halogeometricum borinquense DSM 11551]ELY27837.1 hypothetical protein C499_08337 [Halogeometricum borinquense DSM 11551]QIQ75080.1 hypothetical protein GL213_00070 [Halogeometricum borinquense]